MTREEALESMTIQDAIGTLRDCNCYGTMDIAKSVILDYFYNEKSVLEDIKSELESDVMKFNKRPEISYDAAFSDGIEHALTIIDKHISEKENE